MSELHNPAALEQIHPADRPIWRRMLETFRKEIAVVVNNEGPPSRHYARYTDEEDACLREEWEKGHFARKALSNKLGRTTENMRERVKALKKSGRW